MFTRIDEVGWAQSTAFKKAFSMDVDIEFVGVWDTVSSVGLIPTTPLAPDGQTIEPSVSVPTAATARSAAATTPEPELEPQALSPVGREHAGGVARQQP